jgi:hypothetical protein
MARNIAEEFLQKREITRNLQVPDIYTIFRLRKQGIHIEEC